MHREILPRMVAILCLIRGITVAISVGGQETSLGTIQWITVSILLSLIGAII